MRLINNFLPALILPALLLITEPQCNALPQTPDEPVKKTPDSATPATMPLPQIEHHGIINITEIGAGFGLGDTDPDFSRSVVSLSGVFDYEIKKNILAGLGTGVNFYNGGAMIPLYIDARYYFNDLKTTPFVVLDFGEMFSLENISHSGLFVNPMVGVRRMVKDKILLNLSMGGLVQHAPDGIRNSFINFKFGATWRVKESFNGH